MDFKSIKRLYFLGIGGIGMSAIARYFNGLGKEVYGYDRTSTELTRKLESEGMIIHYEEDIAQIPEGIDLVVLTPAVPKAHQELNWFIENDYIIKKRAEVLGIISRNRKTVAVAGTHGKTTTSSIVAHMLRVGGVDCSAFLGGIATNFNSNFVEGKSDWVVVEADEYDRSFLQLSPDIALILSMDADHLDIYGDESSIHESGFKAFAKKLKPGGELLVFEQFAEHFEDEAIISFGIEKGDFQALNIRVVNGYFVFDVNTPKGELKALKFGLPGRHNVLNALSAIAVAQKLGLKEVDIRKALLEFAGIKRRFEFLVRRKNCVYIDDYAHHPTELYAAINAAKELYPTKKITGVFQPHLYSRTRDFVDGFAKALDGLDEVILMDIYPARELPIEGVTSELIFKKMTSNNKVLVTKDNLMEHIEGREFEVLMTLGAGDIDLFRNPIKEQFEK